MDGSTSTNQCEVVKASDYDALKIEIEVARAREKMAVQQRNMYHTICEEWGATETAFQALDKQLDDAESMVRERK